MIKNIFSCNVFQLGNHERTAVFVLAVKKHELFISSHYLNFKHFTVKSFSYILFGVLKSEKYP